MNINPKWAESFKLYTTAVTKHLLYIYIYILIVFMRIRFLLFKVHLNFAFILYTQNESLCSK